MEFLSQLISWLISILLFVEGISTSCNIKKTRIDHILTTRILPVAERVAVFMIMMMMTMMMVLCVVIGIYHKNNFFASTGGPQQYSNCRNNIPLTHTQAFDFLFCCYLECSRMECNCSVTFCPVMMTIIQNNYILHFPLLHSSLSCVYCTPI